MNSFKGLGFGICSYQGSEGYVVLGIQGLLFYNPQPQIKPKQPLHLFLISLRFLWVGGATVYPEVENCKGMRYLG